MGSPKRPHIRNYDGMKKMAGKGSVVNDYSSINFKDLNNGYTQTIPSSLEPQNQVNEILKNRMLGALLEARRTPDFNSPMFSTVDIYTSKKTDECAVRSDTFFGGLIAKDQDILINEDVLVNKSYDYQRFLVRKSLYEIKNNDFKIYSPVEAGHLATNALTFGAGLVGSLWLYKLGMVSVSSFALPLIAGVLLSQYLMAKRLQNRDLDNTKKAFESLKGNIEKEKILEDIKSHKASFLESVLPLFTNQCSLKAKLKLAQEIL